MQLCCEHNRKNLRMFRKNAREDLGENRDHKYIIIGNFPVFLLN